MKTEANILQKNMLMKASSHVMYKHDVLLFWPGMRSCQVMFVNIEILWANKQERNFKAS